MSPEGMGEPWLSGNLGGRSIPGGTGWGHWLGRLGDNGRVSLSWQWEPYLSIQVLNLPLVSPQSKCFILHLVSGHIIWEGLLSR